MSSVLDRVESLLALASSSNENEARTAAVLAVQLIRKHRLVISMPSRPDHAFRGRARSEPEVHVARRNTPVDPRRESPSPGANGGGAKRPRSSKGVKRAIDPPEKIVAPLGGECVFCKGRYRREAPIYWFAARGGMHAKCFEDWTRQG
jgi:hypothetical protein